MRITAYRYGFIVQLFLIALMVVAMILSVTGVVNIMFLIVAILLFTLASGQPFMGLVTISDEGVSVRSLGVKKGAIRWSDIKEIGIATQNTAGKKRCFMYFSRSMMGNADTAVLSFNQNNDLIWAECTKRVLLEVQKHYDGAIRYMEKLDA